MAVLKGVIAGRDALVLEVPEIVYPLQAQSGGGGMADGTGFALESAGGIEQAEELLRVAGEQVQALRDDGYLRGYNEGRKAAEEDVLQEIAALAAVVGGVEEARERHFADLEPRVVRLALAIAEKILHRQVALDPGIVVDVVRDGLRRLAGAESVTVRLAPEDVDLVKEHGPDLAAGFGDQSRIRVVADPAMPRGGCMIESEAGEVDARLETQLDEVGQRLMEAWAIHE